MAFVKILRQSRRECKLSPLEGPAMVNVRSDSVPVSVDAVIDSLRIRGIAFHGPFSTPGRRTVFVVESHLLLQSELAELLAQNKLVFCPINNWSFLCAMAGSDRSAFRFGGITVSAPFSRAYGRQATKVYSGRGADTVMQSNEVIVRYRSCVDVCAVAYGLGVLALTCYKTEMPKIIARWLLFKYLNGEFAPLSKPFKTKAAAEKARLKYPERERGAIGVGLIRIVK
jgi:hypothetical protein